MTNSNEKGKRGERELAKWLRDNFNVFAKRGQQHSGSPDSPDVVADIPGIHLEVKRVEKLNLHTAMEQAKRDCGDNVPVVCHRRNRSEWLVTVPAGFFFSLLMVDDI